jgi:hypothetical protein
LQGKRHRTSDLDDDLYGSDCDAAGGAAYAAFLLPRRPRTVIRLALGPFAVVVNTFSLLLAIAAAFDLRW